jgi:hypothetical protein
MADSYYAIMQSTIMHAVVLYYHSTTSTENITNIINIVKQEAASKKKEKIIKCSINHEMHC